jgi:hypothetical protein
MDNIMQPNKLAPMTPVKPYPNHTTNNNESHRQYNDDDDATVSTSNCSHNNTTPKTHHETAFHVTGIHVPSDHAIADTGATGHFVLPGTPVTNIAPVIQALVINLPDGKQLVSTHTCCLNVPWLPAPAREAHIVPGLAHASLVSIKTLCDAGCRVTYDDENCRVYFNQTMVWIGHREPTTGLWVLPLDPLKTTDNVTPTRNDSETNHVASNAYTMTSKESLIKYLHQCLFSPPKRTLIKAINNNQFTTWPGLTAKAVQQYLLDNAPATGKGHMKRQRQGIRSTKIKLHENLEQIETERDMNPPQEKVATNHLFCYTGRSITPKHSHSLQLN